jgi:hypothetical protein
MRNGGRLSAGRLRGESGLSLKGPSAAVAMPDVVNKAMQAKPTLKKFDRMAVFLIVAFVSDYQVF